MYKLILLIIILSGIPISYFSLKDLFYLVVGYIRLIRSEFGSKEITPDCTCDYCKQSLKHKSPEELQNEKRTFFNHIVKQLWENIKDQGFHAFFYSGVTLLALYNFLIN